MTAALAWSAELGAPIDLDLDAPAVARARVRSRARRCHDRRVDREHRQARRVVRATHDRATDDIEPGSLLVFARTESDDSPDLVALAIGRDDARRHRVHLLRRRRDPSRLLRHALTPTSAAMPQRRVLNTFLRTGNRWPPKGTHYLAGELLVHVIRTR